jgi:hypothetical protein
MWPEADMVRRREPLELATQLQSEYWSAAQTLLMGISNRAPLRIHRERKAAVSTLKLESRAAHD